MAGSRPRQPGQRVRSSGSPEIHNPRSPGQAAQASSLVTAGRARAHLRMLQSCGLRPARIAELAGVPRSTLRRIEEGQQGRIRLEVEERLLTVQPSVTEGVPVGPVQELLDQLGRAGFSVSWVARELGVSRDLLRLRGGRVDDGLADQLKILVGQLLTPEADSGPTPEQVLAPHMRAAQELGKRDHSWKAHARCATLDPAVRHLFSAWTEEAQLLAVAECQRCPVTAPCLDEAMATGDLGVWGGTTQWERVRRRRKARQGVA